MTKSKKLTVRLPSVKSEGQPATRKMLRLVRDELKSSIQSLEFKMDAKFTGLETKMESRFQSMEARFAGLEGRMESRFSKMEASYSRMELLLEEQNANNRIVLEGLRSLFDRQERLEQRL